MKFMKWTWIMISPLFRNSQRNRESNISCLSVVKINMTRKYFRPITFYSKNSNQNRLYYISLLQYITYHQGATRGGQEAAWLCAGQSAVSLVRDKTEDKDSSSYLQLVLGLRWRCIKETYRALGLLPSRPENDWSYNVILSIHVENCFHFFLLLTSSCVARLRHFLKFHDFKQKFDSKIFLT